MVAVVVVVGADGAVDGDGTAIAGRAQTAAVMKVPIVPARLPAPCSYAACSCSEGVRLALAFASCV